MVKIIGISGVRGSGKSSLGQYLADFGYKRFSLATWLKERCITDFGLSYDQTYGDKKESPTGFTRTDGAALTGRDIMIRMGIFYRSIDPLFFCKKLVEIADYVKADKIVIDDIRFLNEVQYFKTFGAEFVRLERQPELNCYKAALDDLSETELNNYKDWFATLDAQHNINLDDLKQFSDYINMKVNVIKYV